MVIVYGVVYGMQSVAERERASADSCPGAAKQRFPLLGDHGLVVSVENI